MARKKERMEARINLYLTPEQKKRLDQYIVNVGIKLGRIPKVMWTKIGRMAIEEWLDRHENDFDIDWNSAK